MKNRYTICLKCNKQNYEDKKKTHQVILHPVHLDLKPVWLAPETTLIKYPNYQQNLKKPVNIEV